MDLPSLDTILGLPSLDSPPSGVVVGADEVDNEPRSFVMICFSADDSKRFWEKVDRSGGLQACWPWLGGVDKQGYGKIQIGPFSLRAHRVALWLARGEEGPVTIHSCDNEPCCNPLHLTAGTQKENRQDSLAKGRIPLGETHHNANLSDAQIEYIRRRWAPRQGASLAREFGVTPSTISNIINRVGRFAEGGETRLVAAYSEKLSDNIHCNTPERELEIVRSFAAIGLDPCGNATSTVKARVEWWGKQGDPKEAHYCDGLIASWRLEVDIDEIVFLQPPYGKLIVPWIAKANEEAERGVEITGLLPGRFDTKWFRSMKPARICWYGRRIPFVDHSKPEQKDTAKFPSVFPYWGRRVERFEQIFGKHGVVTTWK